MSLRKTLAPTAAGMLLFAATLTLAPPAPLAAQEVVQDEGAVYRAWHEASQAGDNAKAMAAAKAYLEKYPKGQYADFIQKWYGTAQMTALDAAIKEKRTADMIAVGRDILAADPENLNVLYALASRSAARCSSRPPTSRTPRPPSSWQEGDRHGRVGQDADRCPTFDKNGTLAWLTQMLAVNEGKPGTPRRRSGCTRSRPPRPRTTRRSRRQPLAAYTLR